MRSSDMAWARLRTSIRPLAPVLRPVRDWTHRMLRARHAARYPTADRLCVTDLGRPDSDGFDPRLQALEAAFEVHRPSGDWGPEYDIVKAAFDPVYYFAQNRIVRDRGIDPVAHYLRAGARDNRDPAPWFSTAEYRRRYLSRASAKTNPFVHYLTVGRAAGYAPRAPANFDVFCRSIDLEPQQAADLVTDRMANVRRRLRAGGLGDMVAKAAVLEPLILKSWPAALQVRVPPASNEFGVRRIGHLVDLQHQAQMRRARVVITVDSHDLLGCPIEFRRIFEAAIAQAGAAEVVVVVTGQLRSTSMLDASVRVVQFGLTLPECKTYGAGRTLVEFVRSLRPDTIINLDARLMMGAMVSFGRALAKRSTIYQYLGQAEGDGGASLGAKYYRAVDTGLRVIVASEAARDILVERFVLPASAAAAIWVADEKAHQHDILKTRVEALSIAC